RGRRERDERRAGRRTGNIVPEARQRVRPRGLPVMAETFREGHLEPVVVGLAATEVLTGNPQIGPGALANVAERVVHAGRRVVAQSRVGLEFLAATPVPLIGALHARRVPALPLKALLRVLTVRHSCEI